MEDGFQRLQTDFRIEQAIVDLWNFTLYAKEFINRQHGAAHGIFHGKHHIIFNFYKLAQEGKVLRTLRND